MKIERDGQTYELTRGELIEAAMEYSQIRKDSIVEEAMEDIRVKCLEYHLSEDDIRSIAERIAEDVVENDCEYAWCVNSSSYGGLQDYINEL